MAANFTEITMLNSQSVQFHYHSIIFMYRFSPKGEGCRSSIDVG